MPDVKIRIQDDGDLELTIGNVSMGSISTHGVTANGYDLAFLHQRFCEKAEPIEQFATFGDILEVFEEIVKKWSEK